MSKIERFNVEARYSDMAIFNGVAYLAGQIAEDLTQDAQGQTHEVLRMVDALLAQANSDKSRILMAQIYLADLADYDAMNMAWDEWVRDIDGNAPPRATVQAALAGVEYKVEIVVTAAQKLA